MHILYVLCLATAETKSIDVGRVELSTLSALSLLYITDPVILGGFQELQLGYLLL